MTDFPLDEYGPWHRVRVGSRAAGTDELVRGHDRDEAMANAERTWPWSTVVYVGVDDVFADEPAATRSVCEPLNDPPDWWGADYPGHAEQEPCVQYPDASQEYVR